MHTAGAWLRLPCSVTLTQQQRVAREELLRGDAAASDPSFVFVSCPIPDQHLMNDIDVKEHCSLLCLVLVLLQRCQWVLESHSHLVMAGDNMHVCHSEQLEGKGSVDMLRFAEELVLLQLRNSFTMSHTRVSTTNNALSDLPSRFVDRQDVQLIPDAFLWLWRRLGPFDLDGMASERTAHRAPSGKSLPLCSRFVCPTLPGLPRLQFFKI